MPTPSEGHRHTLSPSPRGVTVTAPSQRGVKIGGSEGQPVAGLCEPPWSVRLSLFVTVSDGGI